MRSNCISPAYFRKSPADVWTQAGDGVQWIPEAASGQRTVCCWREDMLRRLKLSEVFCFKVVDDRSYVCTQRKDRSADP